jgi:hypothetical protein
VTRSPETDATRRQLTQEERSILTVLASAERPLDPFETFAAIEPYLPGPPGALEGTPQHEAWTLRRLDLHSAMIDLQAAELVAIVVDATGSEPWQGAITDSGREALALNVASFPD